MSVVINTNYAAVLARKNLAEVQRQMDSSVERLSSGQRINNAADDAAGSAIAGRMESQIRGLTMAIRHAKDGQSLVGTSEGAMQEVNKILQRMRELAVQAVSGVASQTDKNYLQLEMKHLISEIYSIGQNTKFNDMNLLTGGTFTFYTDIDVAGSAITTVTAQISLSKLNVATATVSIGGGETAAGINDVISVIDQALARVDNKRAALGAVSNRFDHIIDKETNFIKELIKEIIII